MSATSWGPNKVRIDVPQGSNPYVFNGATIPPGGYFWVDKCIAHCYLGEAKKENLPQCFPERRCGADGQWDYSNAYANLFSLPAETEVIIDVPQPAGCAPPAIAELIACGGGCMLIELDAPVEWPAPGAAVLGGIAPHLGVQRIDLCATKAQQIHVISGVDQLLNVYFWGACC